MEKLWMSHPDLPDNPAVPVTRLAYDDVWRPRGWLLVDTPPEHSELADRPATVPEPAPEPAPEQPAEPGDDPEPDSDAGAKSTGKTGRK